LLLSKIISATVLVLIGKKNICLTKKTEIKRKTDIKNIQKKGPKVGYSIKELSSIFNNSQKGPFKIWDKISLKYYYITLIFNKI